MCQYISPSDTSGFVSDLLHVKDEAAVFSSHQVCKVQHGERRGGANALQSIRDQV